MLAHSIDKQSSRGKTFSHSSAAVMMGHFAGGCVDGKEREGVKNKAELFIIFLRPVDKMMF